MLHHHHHHHHHPSLCMRPANWKPCTHHTDINSQVLHANVIPVCHNAFQCQKELKQIKLTHSCLDTLVVEELLDNWFSVYVTNYLHLDSPDFEDVTAIVGNRCSKRSYSMRVYVQTKVAEFC